MDLYREYFNRSADAILIIKNDIIIDCNPRALQMLRFDSIGEILKIHPSALSPELQPDGQSSREKADRMMEIAFRDGSKIFEWYHKRADGEVFPVEVTLTAIPAEDGPILHTVWRDITERKKAEAEIAQAHKLEATVQLIGGIAHDFNNLLLAILGNAELMAMELDPEADPRLQGYVREIRNAGDRAAELVGQLLAYSRKQVLRPRIVDLNDVVEAMARRLEPVIDAGLSLEPRLSTKPALVKADPGQLEQVLENLVTNATDAMPGGGRIIIEVFITELAERETSGGVGIAGGAFAGLRVIDAGTGIAADIIDRIFDPYFTTRKTRAGLGLSAVTGFVKQSGGDIQVLSEVGVGTTITMHLPLSTEDKDFPVEAASGSAAEASGRLTVFLVEDDPGVARLAERFLQRQGHEIIFAPNGREALDLYESGAVDFDLLMTDVMMPELKGPELARILADRVKDLKVLYISGYTNEVLSSRGILDPGVDLITKPYSVDELQAAITRVMSA